MENKQRGGASPAGREASARLAAKKARGRLAPAPRDSIMLMGKLIFAGGVIKNSIWRERRAAKSRRAPRAYVPVDEYLTRVRKNQLRI